jgi:hypothetical protein
VLCKNAQVNIYIYEGEMISFIDWSLKIVKAVWYLENNPEYKFCVTNLNFFYNQGSAKFDYNVFK